MKNIIILILLFIPFVIVAQTQELDTPELPSWITDTIYIDFEAVGSANLGTYEDPVNTFPWDGIPIGYDWSIYSWHPSEYWVMKCDNIAFLFKRGNEHIWGDELLWDKKLGFLGDSLYIGSYGSGERPIIKHRGMLVRGWGNTVEGVVMMTFDPFFNTVLTMSGNSHLNGGHSDVYLRNVNLSRGNMGLQIPFVSKVYIDSVYIEEIGQNGIFGGSWMDGNFDTDSVFIHNTTIKDVNLNYFNIQMDASGGDGAQIGARYVEYVNCVIDKGKTSQKQALIHNFSNVEFINSFLITHPNNGNGLRGGRINGQMPAGADNPEIYRGFNATNSVFFGGARTLMTWNRGRYINNIFVGYGKDVSDTYTNQEPQGDFFDQTWSMNIAGDGGLDADFYNNVFVNVPNIISAGAAPFNFQNNILYNVGQLSTGREVYGSSNIFHNDDETTISDLFRMFFSYREDNNYFTGMGVREDPGTGTHIYYVALQNSGPSYGGDQPLTNSSYWMDYGTDIQAAVEAMGNMFVDPQFINPSAHSAVKVDYYPTRRTLTRNHGATHFELYMRPGQGSTSGTITDISNINVTHSGYWFAVPNDVTSFTFRQNITGFGHADLIAELIEGEWQIRYIKNHPYYELNNFDVNNFRLQSTSPAINSGNSDVYDPIAIYGRPGSVNASTQLFTLTETNYTFLLDVDPWHVFEPYAYKDFAGTPRGYGGGVDIGTYEYTTSATTYTLTTSTTGSGTITRNPNQGSYDEGASVELTANPASGWEFTSWSGDLSGSTNPETLVMNSAKSVTANFTEISHPVPVADIIALWAGFNYTPLSGLVYTSTLVDQYNTQWDSIANNMYTLRLVLDELHGVHIGWNDDPISYINTTLNARSIRDSINTTNNLLFANMDSLYTYTLALAVISVVLDYNDVQNTILTTPSPQQFLGLFNWNVGILIDNTTAIYNALNAQYGY